MSGQRTDEGTDLLRACGVTDIDRDYLREFGRGANLDPNQACGHCGYQRAAILPDATVTPCPLTRWMNAGNVTRAAGRYPPHRDRVGRRHSRPAEHLPTRRGLYAPDKRDPDNLCKPTGRAAQKALNVTAFGSRDCMPDHYCNPTCVPGACKPNFV